MAVIKGISITLYDLVQSGTDEFNAPVYTESPVTVENVLVSPVAAADVVNDVQLYGKRAEYELCIPKGDSHVWENRKVAFFDQTFRTFGYVQEYIEDMVPLSWNKKVKVECYG